MGILEVTFAQIAEHFPLHPRRIHREHLILDFEDEVDGEFKGYRIARPDSRTLGYADTLTEAREIIDAELDETALAGASPRNREPLTAAEQRREEHNDEAANDRATGRGGF